MDSKLVYAILISTVLGGAIGFGSSYTVFNSQIQSLQKDLANTKTTVTDIQNDLANVGTVFARWNVTWVLVGESGGWGASVGNSTWGPVFDYNFGYDALFGGYADDIGFIATMTINMQRDGPVHFVIGSDDGSQLWVDDAQWINNWYQHQYREMSVTKNLSKGKHTLTLLYYEVDSVARVSFNCDPDILMWNN